MFALYVDPEEPRLDADRYDIGGNRAAKDLNNAAIRQSTSTGRAVHPDQILSRTAFRVQQGSKMSFGTYFNGFPASYWRRWSVVSEVRLSVTIAGPGRQRDGLQVDGQRPLAARRRRDRRQQCADARATFDFDLTLTPFVDGGWYWYDVVAGDEDAVVESAEWTAEVPADREQHGTVDIVITTVNKPDFCAKLLTQIGEDETLRPYLDTVFVSEQGTQKVADHELFPLAEKALGDLLVINEQGNLGGSGGYARGQLESVRKGTATYAMMMDDDVVCEPESIVRAITFGDLARRPTIVGGHMFSLFSRSRLHSFGEIVQPWRFWWQTPLDGYSDWDLAARNIRSARWLHKRVDVDFNGWFMCLIPRVVLERDRPVAADLHQVGRPGVRPARQAARLPDGDLPGRGRLARAVDRQERRRRLAGLLPPPQPLHLGAAPLAVPQRRPAGAREPQPPDQAPRLAAVLHRRDPAPGAARRAAPARTRLHEQLPGKLGEVNAFRKQFTDAQLHTDPDTFPPIRRTKPPRKGKGPARRSPGASRS